MRDIYELNNTIWCIKTNFLEAIKHFRLSIGGTIVLFKVFRPLRALKTEEKSYVDAKEEPIYLYDNVYES